MNYLEFLSKNQKRQIIESFKTSDLNEVHNIMLSIFRKKIGDDVIKWDWINTIIKGKDMISFFFLKATPRDPMVWCLNYLNDGNEHSDVYSVTIFDERGSNDFLWAPNKPLRGRLTINTLGTSVACFIPIICHIVNNRDYKLTNRDALKLANEIFNKGQKNESSIFKYGNVNYRIYESLDDSDIDDMFYLNSGFTLVREDRTEAQEYRWKRKTELENARRRMRETGSRADRDAFLRIEDEYKAILNAIRGGAETIEDIKMSISRDVPVEIEIDNETRRIEHEIEEERDPEESFKEMQIYIKTVLKGLQPGLILCGAPGVGKTYKVLQQLKAAGYEDGKNMDIIKGKCTTRSLYLSLFQYKKKGDIIVIDDADALVGPYAPEDSINILKAALDSTATDEGRKISYRIAGQLLDHEGREVPKTCYYNGGVIVITNYSMGQLDTALRGRTFVQSLDFSTKQILKLIEKRLPDIGKGQLSDEAKNEAFEYLNELADAKASMEISFRTFMTCARLFEVCKDEDGISKDTVKSMIKEQMENQAIRGGKKY